MPVDKNEKVLPELVATLKTLQTKLQGAYKVIIEHEVTEGIASKAATQQNAEQHKNSTQAKDAKKADDDDS